MKILYDNKTGKIYYVVPDYKWYWFKHSTSIPLTEMTIEETPENKEQCIDLYRNYYRIDEEGEGKYKIDKGIITEKENWEEYIVEDLTLNN